MQNRKALLSFLSIAFILALAWLFLFITESLLKENSNRNLKHVPKEATFAIRLDSKEIAEHTLFSIFLESKDKEVIKLLQHSLSKNIKKDGQFKNFGIDYLSDLVVFEIPYKNTLVQGLIVNVSNERLFRKNMPSTDNPFACKDNVGVILLVPTKNKNVLPSELSALAIKIAQNIEETTVSTFKHTQKSGEILEIYSKGTFLGESSFVGRSNVLFELQQKSLAFNGDLTLNERSTKQPKTIENIVKPHGLHISTSLIPANLSDTIKQWLNKFKVTIPPIEQFSMNFMGTKVINHSSGFFIVPQIEILITCESEVSIQKVLSTPELQAFFDYGLNNGSISFQDEKLYFKQISPKSFYIGITENTTFGKSKTKDLFHIEGSLKPLTDIEGGGLMTSFLEMMPIYRASKNLANHTEIFKLQILKTSSSKAKLKGELRFSDEYSPMNELVKFLLVGQIVK